MAQQRIGKYRVLERIAAGGQATVYRAWDIETGRVAALKVMHAHLVQNAAYIERFQREASLTSSIDHPNVLRIYEVGQDGENHFIAMEYLAESLHHVMEAEGRFPIERAVQIAHQVCLGLPTSPP